MTQIINQNAEWSAGSIHILSDTLQIAVGVVLKIDPGATVTGGSIQVFGTLVASGISVRNVNLDGGGSDPTVMMSIDNSVLVGGTFLKTGISSFSLTNSTLTNVAGDATIWPPVLGVIPDDVISGNLFDGFGGFSITTTGPSVRIDHNMFLNITPSWNGDPSLGGAPINSWSTWDNSHVIVEHNNFLDVGKPTLALPNFGSNASMTATSNYFGTSDPVVVSAIIYDKNDDLKSAGYISIASTLFTPDPTAPQIITSLDTTFDQPVTTVGQPYLGPTAGLQRQYINVTSDNLAVTTVTSNWFIHTGSGSDAINVSKSGGSNVLDGSTGSNFLTGGSGSDTFFLDDRTATADIWSTVVGFHPSDNATIWGVTLADFHLSTSDNQGAAGFTGLNFGFTATGRASANLTIAGYTSADISSGRLAISYGSTPDQPELPGSKYMLIHGN